MSVGYERKGEGVSTQTHTNTAQSTQHTVHTAHSTQYTQHTAQHSTALTHKHGIGSLAQQCLHLLGVHLGLALPLVLLRVELPRSKNSLDERGWREGGRGS